MPPQRAVVAPGAVVAPVAPALVVAPAPQGPGQPGVPVQSLQMRPQGKAGGPAAPELPATAPGQPAAAPMVK